MLPTVVSRCRIITLPAKSEIILTKEIFDSQFAILNSLLRGGVGERLKQASKVGTSKEEIASFFEQFLASLRKLMKEKEQKNVPFVTIIRRLQKAQRQLEANVNPRLVLEVFFLDSPSKIC